MPKKKKGGAFPEGSILTPEGLRRITVREKKAALGRRLASKRAKQSQASNRAAITLLETTWTGDDTKIKQAKKNALRADRRERQTRRKQENVRKAK